MSYDKYDAMADAAQDKFDEGVGEELALLIDPITSRIQEMDPEANYPRPWTYDRRLLEVWTEEGDDALQELLEEEYREEAEEAYKDGYDSGPCCNQFSCPCGNSNNYPG